MRYDFVETPAEGERDKILATALNGVAYTENGRLHIKSNAFHYVYKYDGDPVGWYMRNTKTLDDFYLGKGACPSVEMESLVVKDEEAWASILEPVKEESDLLKTAIEKKKGDNDA